ncbi:MAG: hypothetical protein WHU10_11985, partial [Fimbriimonadales bacterium]
ANRRVQALITDMNQPLGFAIGNALEVMEVSQTLQNVGPTDLTRLALELGPSPEITLIQLGGHYRPERMDFVGPLAANAIDQLRGYTAFLGADGLSLEFGISATDIQTAYLYQHVIKNARDAVLLVDHTKFQAPSLFRIAELEAVSRIVTDVPPSEAWREALATRGIDLVCPEVSTVAT